MLHISLFGEQSITDLATGSVRTRSARTVALIAFLAVHAGMPQTRQRIAGLFWPDSTDAQALTNLRRELHHLRQVLVDDPSLVVTPRDLCWRDTETCRVDVRTFSLEREAALAASATAEDVGVLRHAALAIAEYRGELLPGIYDDWLLEARSAIERQCVDLCDLLVDVRARTGDLSGAAEAARRRIALQPLEEAGYRTLMQLQADLGDRAGAVSTYHHCASVLERELGIDPDPATRRTLHELLARARPAAATAVRQAARAAGTAVPAGEPESERTTEPATEPAGRRSGLAAAELYGRSEEFAVLRAAWQGAAAGRPSLVLVRGDAGVGKTRLVAELADEVRSSGGVVASAQCFGTSGRLALAPVADWLRTPAIQSAALDPVWRVEVERLVPSAKDDPNVRAAATISLSDTGVGSRAMVDAWQRHRFFEGMARALTGIDRPILLVLDNLQWCDQETLAFLSFCLGLTTDARILVAATLRTDNLDEEPEVLGWTARMWATGMLTEVSLGPLDVHDTARLAEAIAGRPLLGNDMNLLHAMTGGFPLYVVEAARTTVDVGDSPVPIGDFTSVLRNRLEQVSPTVRDVAGLAAAVGRNFTLDLLTEASDLDADAVVRAVDELWRHRILREFRDGYDFSHDLLRESAYNQISPPRRWLLHRRIAQGLELLHANDTDAVSAQLAEQYARGGRPERAMAYYRRAADVAASRFAHNEAIRLHKEALSIVLTLPEGRDRERQELEVLEAMAAPLNASYGYSSPELQQTLSRSVVLAEGLGRKGSALTALVGLWASQFVQGKLDPSFHTVTRALTLVVTDPVLTGSAQFAFAGSLLSLGRPEESLRHFALIETLTRGAPSLTIGTRPDVHGKAWAAHAHWLIGQYEEAVASCQDAIDHARGVEHPYSLAVALAYGGITYQMLEDLPKLDDTVQELRELCDRYDFAYYREWGLILGGWAEGGAAGLQLIHQGIDNLKSDGSFARMPYWLSLLADTLQRNNRPDSAKAILDAAIVDAQARRDSWWLPEVLRLRAAYDANAAVRLKTAVQLAQKHGSVALIARCERDLAALTR
ncbi:ATP-binding protein [Jatrophihabitans sp. DSM 45814]